LFYPGKEDLYIEVTTEDFEAVANGEEMYLEVASVTGEVLFLKKGDRIFKEPMEFSFSDK
jgi:NOL1/NOP2/fmu family ribosome biogenesis protein